MIRRGVVISLLLACGLAVAPPAGALNINLVPGSSLASVANAPALAAFQRAAVRWEARIADPVTVNINADLRNLGGSTIIGQTASVLLAATHDFMRGLAVVDAADEADDGIVSALPSTGSFTVSLPSGFTSSGYVISTKANIKALGVSGLDKLFGSTDATIEFNSNFSFDYDNRDGVAAGLMDFETVAAHEIGHALGFISQVDRVDYVLDAGIDPSTISGISPTLLDLFRFNAANVPATTGEFNSLPREMRPGEAALFSDLSHQYPMATGTAFGDGDQASHWKDDNNDPAQHIGIMDPTLAFGRQFDITPADLRALDVIGYDIASVPLPGGLVLMLPALVLLGLATRSGPVGSPPEVSLDRSPERTRPTCLALYEG